MSIDTVPGALHDLKQLRILSCCGNEPSCLPHRPPHTFTRPGPKGIGKRHYRGYCQWIIQSLLSSIPCLLGSMCNRILVNLCTVQSGVCAQVFSCTWHRHQCYWAKLPLL